MSKIKQTRPGTHMAPLEFEAYSKEPKLCVLNTLNAYLLKTLKLRTKSKLFISYIKPHLPVSKDTIARWCKDVMKVSGIDITRYTTHSCRSAVASKAKSAGVPINKIMECAGWKSDHKKIEMDVTSKLVE